MSTQEIDYNALKAGGVIRQSEAGLHSIRIRVPAGNITAGQMAKIAELANTYGRGTAHLTMRQGIEIPNVRIEDMPKVRAGLEDVGMEFGACGPRVRVVTACQGCKVCPHGLGDAPELALELDSRFYGLGGLPFKFKMGVTGCPNSCIKPQENDVGFMATAIPGLEENEDRTCTGCGLCAEICPTKAIKIVDGKAVIDMDKCCRDGKCARVCPTDAMQIVQQGWDVFVGGKWGREPRIGTLYRKCVTAEEAFDLVSRILVVYKRLGQRRERVITVIDRVGLEAFREAVQSSKTSDLERE